MFSETGFVALVVGLCTLAASIAPAIVQGFQRREERHQSARTKAIEAQLNLLYKPLLRILEAHTTPFPPDPNPEDWDDAVRGHLSEAFALVDENLELASSELVRLLYGYRELVAEGAANSYEELDRLHRHVRGKFDQLRQELYLLPNQPSPRLFARLWKWLGWQMWGRWRAQKF